MNILKVIYFRNLVFNSEEISLKVDDESIYWRKKILNADTLVVEVHNKELGKSIYDTITTLKRNATKIITSKAEYNISNYACSEKGIINWYSINVNLKEKSQSSIPQNLEYFWNELKPIERLQEITSIIYDLVDNNYDFNNTLLVENKCNCISRFISSFTYNESGEIKFEEFEGGLVKYVHNVLSNNQNFEELYTQANEQGICEANIFPYGRSIIKMCNEYFTNGTVSQKINLTLAQGTALLHSPLVIVNLDNFKKSHSLKEDNEVYAKYDSGIKIYHNKKRLGEIIAVTHNWLWFDCLEHVDKIISDLDSYFIGYTYTMDDSGITLSEYFKSPYRIFNLAYHLHGYIKIKFYNKIYNSIISEERNPVDISKCIVIRSDYQKHETSLTAFKIIDMDSYVELLYSTSQEELNKQFVLLIFDLYMSSIYNEYGNISNERQLYRLIEIRYLSANLAKELVKYALGNPINYEKTYNFLNDFLDDAKGVYNGNKEYAVDPKYLDDDCKLIPFIFDNEFEEKYGTKLKKGMKETLPDGCKIVTYERKRKSCKEYDKEKKIKNDLLSYGIETDEHLRFAGISQVIYSKKIDNETGKYYVAGYITAPIKGKSLTEDLVLSFNSIQLLKACVYLFSKFQTRYIPFGDAISVDKDFIFYIHILSDTFAICECGAEPFNNQLFKLLYNKKYNIFALFAVTNCYPWNIERVNTYTSLCNKHNVYYPSNGRCPVCSKLYSKKINTSDLRKEQIVLEDTYAKHYQFSTMCTQVHKIYKDHNIAKKVEENIDRMLVSKEFDFDVDNDYYQECFLPGGKVLDNDGNFIGYSYDSRDLEGAIDLQDFEKMINLPRVKSLTRLMLQVQKIMYANQGFIENPFTYVFLNRKYKKQVQIVNIEFLCDKNSKSTKLWVCKYVERIVNADDTIELKYNAHSVTSLETMIDKNKSLENKLTKYCPVHKFYYKDEYLFCPKCIGKKEISNYVINERKKFVTKKQLMNEGGEAFIYPYDDGVVAKVFKEDQVNQHFKDMTLARIMQKREILKKLNSQNNKFQYIIPEKLLIEDNNIFGYVMKEVSGMPLSILRDKVEADNIGFNTIDVLEILITVAAGIELLHKEANIYIGDLNGRNILFDSKKNVYFLDFDGMGIDNIAPEFCTDGYIDPISKKNQTITMKDDWYSFAVQAFYYLTFTHPFNGIYPKDKTLSLIDKMERRISLLGNHEMQPPTIAKSWEWMNSELLKAFLKIFEGDCRENISTYLIHQYEGLKKGNADDIAANDIPLSIRINPKFIATKIDEFDEEFNKDIIRVINHYSAVCYCKKYDMYYLIVKTNNSSGLKIELKSHTDINNVLLSKDEKIVFIISNKKIVAISLDTRQEITVKDLCGETNVVVNDSVLYYTKGMEEKGNTEYVIVKTDFSNGDVKEDIIYNNDALDDLRIIKWMNVVSNSKFVLIKEEEGSDFYSIYCNSQPLCLLKRHNSFKYNIIYDDVSKIWLVVNNKGYGALIKPSGTFSEIFYENINDVNIDNISFYKNHIYIPDEDCLYIVDVRNQSTKKMECNKIMTPNSMLYNFNTEGFSVITDNVFYEVRRG